MKYVIDTDKEMIPSAYAAKLNVARSVISNWITRGQIEYRHIEELNLTLVKVGSEITKAKIDRRKRIIKEILKGE